ncbi:hypothetical protein AAG906_028084 [Vitis piasezkii]
MLRMAILTTQVGGIIQIFMEAKSTLVPTVAQTSQQASSLEQAIVNLNKVNTLNKMMDEMQNDLSQKIDNLQYSISRLTNLNTVQEKGRFPSQPHQNPKGIHEVESPTPKLYVEEKEEEETKKKEEMKGKKKDISEEKEDHDSTMNANPEKELIKEELIKKHISTFSSSFA